MKKSLPKGFVKLSSSPTKQGIEKSIGKYYLSNKNLVDKGDFFEVRSVVDDKLLKNIVIETVRGFYFGYFE